jgi:hypothetical protein
MGEIRIVFDGPPAHESGRFVEVEDTEGQGLDAGEWHERDDGLWELRIEGVDLEVVAEKAAWRKAEREIAEEEAREEELANGQFGVGA